MVDPVHLLTWLHVEVVAVSTTVVVAEDAGVAATVATTTTVGVPGRTTTAINPSASFAARRATLDSAASSILTLPSPAHQSNPDLPPLRHMGSTPTGTPTLVLPTTSRESQRSSP